MNKTRLVSVSADLVKTEEELIAYAKEVTGIADFLHCDVMDGIFVKRKNLSADLIKKINDNTAILLDVHLMTIDLGRKLNEYLKAGPNILTIHYEVFKNVKKLIKILKHIREKGILAGVSIKPSTPINVAEQFLPFCDMILINSVEPGKSGQKFLFETFDRVIELKTLIKKYNPKTKISVDGGIVPEIAKKLFESGVDIIVSGSFVFNSKNRVEAIRELKNCD